MAQTARIFTSGIDANRELHVIRAKAPAALVPTIEETIRQLDFPALAPKNAELAVYLLVASDQNDSAGAVPPDLESA